MKGPQFKYKSDEKMEMLEKKMMNSEKSLSEISLQQGEKKYYSPELKQLGKLNTVTLGGISGVGDSGGDFDTELP